MTTVAKISGLAKHLVSSDLLSLEDAEDAFDKALEKGEALISYLSFHNIVDSAQIANVASTEFGLPLLNLDAFDKSSIPFDLIDKKLILAHELVPLHKRGQKLCIAVADPSNLAAISEVKFHTGSLIDLIVVEQDKLRHIINEQFQVEEETYSTEMSGLGDIGLEDIDIEAVVDDNGGPLDDDDDASVDDTPIVRFVNKILLDAIKSGTSDIHIEPYEKVYRVRYRQDGILKEIARPPQSISNRICSRIKIMASMDIAERRIPQDGRIKMKLSKTRSIDFRVNTLPTLWGEKIVMRILDAGSATMGIDALGYEAEQKQLYLTALHQHQGLILVTGPTGSGKTVSLYTGLNILNTFERNISTAEDPVEINLEGVNQVAVNYKVGLNFASALRAFLRQDPDVIMVGEIRDKETAEIAIKAAQTGHLVLSTLHTNSAPETLTRLMNMGIPPFNVATSVTLIIAQRLARRLCSHCKKPLTLPPKVLMQEGFSEQQIQEMQLFGAVGCDKCNDGYKGRVGIYEVMPITDAIARIIMDNGNSIEIGDQARKHGFDNLRQSTLKKVVQGMTSLAEANRVS